MINEALQKIARTKADFLADVAGIQGPQALENVRIEYLSKKGRISELFKMMGSIPTDQRRELGKHLNALKVLAQTRLQALREQLEAQAAVASAVDVTLPGNPPQIGSLHPLIKVLDEIKSIFAGMGFAVEDGPEVETDYYNFEALNIPPDHASRDMQDTFYLGGEYLLRTHTSPVQIRTMESQPPPVRIIAPGRCFRKDTPDATHSPMFHQVEGLVVDEGVSFADLKGVLLAFMRKMFGEDTQIRFRPSFFPFTEPSAEYDVSCPFCKGRGCRICKQAGWIEISGAGMVDPAVFGFVNYDAEKYSGYAFGMGVERVAMLKLQIEDIRTFYENDLRFLTQF